MSLAKTNVLAKVLDIKNSIIDGDFNVIAGWILSNVGSPTPSSNVLPFTATAQYGSVYQRFVGFNITDEYFIYCKVKYTGSGVNLIADNIDQQYRIIPITGDGSVQEVYLTGNIFGAFNTDIGVRDIRGSGWTVIEMSEVWFINKTFFNIESYTEAQMLELIKQINVGRTS